MIRTYSQLLGFSSFVERYRYLALRGQVGDPTFGYDRWMNQDFYTSREWRQLRQEVIARDQGCDLGIPGREIYGGLYVHHMNPMVAADIVQHNEDILNPEYLITTSHQTHNAIHYGDESQLPREFVPRRPGDTKLW